MSTATGAPHEDRLATHWPHAMVLVVDDEAGMRHFLEKALASRVGQVHSADSAEAAQALLARHRYDVVILDITLPGQDGLGLLRDLRAAGNPCEVVLITAFADLDTAIAALRAGANDFLLKPFRLTQVLNAVQRGLQRARLERENFVLRRRLQQQGRGGDDGLAGRSIVIQGLHAAVQKLAPVGSTVLLQGESGTGKELVAQALHRLGPQAAGPFVPVNCASISPGQIEGELFGQGGEARQRDGLFVYAQGGTLFLDEVAELPLPLQARLLRVLEHRRIRPVGSEQEIAVDARIVAATNRPLRQAVQAGLFREDLYYRLQVVELNLPPLRSHKEDIPDLVAHFIAQLAPQLGVPPIAVDEAELRYLAGYDWPGNVRELRNLVERSLIVGALNVSALYQSRPAPAPVAPAPVNTVPGALDPAAPTDLQTLEKRHILAVLAGVQGDKTRAAELLGISRRTLERRCAEWG
ncbi:MAG: sigma-54-dependent transcriptional regulator [Rubrivivax sp.]